MKECLSKLTKDEKLTIVGVFLTIFGSYFGYSGLDKKIRVPISAIICLIGGIILLVQDIKYYKQGLYTERQKKILATLAVLGLIVIFREDSLYLSLVIAANFVHKDLKQLMKIIFYSSIASFLLICFLCLIGLVKNDIHYRNIFNFVVLRETIGFSNPNVVYRFFVPIVLTGLFVFKDKAIYALACLCIGMLLFFITGSRAGLLAIIAFTILCCMPKSIKDKIYNVKLIPYVFLSFTLISILCAILLHKSNLDEYGSARFTIWYNYFKQIGVFANIHKVNGRPLDNLFLNTMHFGGIYGYIYYYCLYLMAFIRNDKKNSQLIFILFLVTFVYGLFENFSAFGESRVLIILFSIILNGDKIDELSEENVQISCQ